MHQSAAVEKRVAAPEEERTTDVGAAAFAVIDGHDIVRVEHSGRWKVFVFPAEARDSIRRYYRGAHAPAQQLVEALRTVKHKLYGRV